MVIIAYGIFFAATILSIMAYKGIPLSMGPVLEATSYIYVTFFGVKIFKESINKKKDSCFAAYYKWYYSLFFVGLISGEHVCR